MKLRGSLLVIVCCLVVEFCNLTQKELIFSTTEPGIVSFLVVAGILLLLYPLIGHLTDVYVTRYRSLTLSFSVFIFTSCVVMVYNGIDFAASTIWNITILHHPQTSFVFFILVILYIVGLALFRANAIQFGLDQLLETPIPKLIAFIYWYYWAQKAGQLALFYVSSSSIVTVTKVTMMSNSTIHDEILTYTITEFFIVATSIIFTAVFIRFCTTKKNFYIHRHRSQSIQEYLQSA